MTEELIKIGKNLVTGQQILIKEINKVLKKMYDKQLKQDIPKNKCIHIS